uniref:Uncharacterized protein n=1 Tax=Nelumbo nucifera TaxID=4432 RepID=A0A822Z816_NELNU|nr:TPA_asm: hypothetical protein HUJ06_015535 [Nelumbo nucifera]
MDTSYVQSATTPHVVESITIPMTTPLGLDIAKANAYATHDERGRSGIIRSRAIPMPAVANILCRLTVHKALQASAFVSATPIAMPWNTEWKHNATINKMLYPNE